MIERTIDDLRREVKDDWIRTLHARMYFLNPREEDFHIEDIAHSLSRENRFCGYIEPEYYTVAQHCVLCTWQAPASLQLATLLHERAESYMRDPATPLKNVLKDFGIIERNMEVVSAPKFGVPPVICDKIKFIDKKMMITEAPQVMRHDDPWWLDKKFDYLGGPYPIKIIPWRPNKAKEMFLKTYHKLMENIDAS